MKLIKILLILTGTVILSLTMLKSGLIYSFGMGFWGPNGHDGIWHIALAESLARGSWDMPTFAGEVLKNYHIGFDLLLVLIHKITSISIVNLYFQIIPPIVALLIGILTFKFVLDWKGSKTSALWATFFVYFGGSLGWIVSLLRGQGIGGESMFWAQQAISTLINPPFALSLVLILAGLICLMKLSKKPQIIYLLLAIFFFGILIQIKAYAGILVLEGLLAAGLFGYFKEKKSTLLKLFFGSTLLSLALFLPFNRAAASLLVFKPFWFLETMMGPDRIDWPRYYSAMLNYKSGGAYLKGALAYLGALIIFLFGNFGTRFLGIKGEKKRITSVEVFIYSVILGGIIIPLLFIQAGNSWNTIQFMYYSLFFAGILAGTVMGKLFENKSLKFRVLLGGGVLFLTLPTSFGTLKHYLPARPPAMLSGSEMEALEFLAAQPEGVVLTYPFDQTKANEAEPYPPRPLYLYTTTAYVSAFSKKPVFLEDEMNLEIMRYDWKGRREKSEEFFASEDKNKAMEFLKDNNISYLYLLRGQEPELGVTQIGLSKVFENDKVVVHKVEKSP